MWGDHVNRASKITLRLTLNIAGLSAVALSAPASAKDPPSANELSIWVSCLKAAGVDPLSGRRSPPVLEVAFDKCSPQESSLRRAISRDPSRDPEYQVENMKNVLRLQ